MNCPGCALELAPSLLSCPSCHTLVHGARLRVLADESKSAAATNDVAAELAAWREAMILLLSLIHI